MSDSTQPEPLCAFCGEPLNCGCELWKSNKGKIHRDCKEYEMRLEKDRKENNG